MNRDFDAYIKGLQEIENYEHTATLRAMCEMNNDALSFFPAIITGIDKIIKSGSVPPDFTKGIEEKLPILLSCKQNYDKLSSAKRSNLYASSIKDLLSRRNTISIVEVESYEQELLALLEKNKAQIKVESVPVVNPEVVALEQKFMRGENITQKERVLLAEMSANKDVIRKLKKTKSISIMEALQKNKLISDSERAYCKNRIKDIKNQREAQQEGGGGCLGCIFSVAMIFGTAAGGCLGLFHVATLIISVL